MHSGSQPKPILRRRKAASFKKGLRSVRSASLFGFEAASSRISDGRARDPETVSSGTKKPEINGFQRDLVK